MIFYVSKTWKWHRFVTFPVVRVDTTPPTVISCPQAQTVPVPISTPSAIANWVEPTAVDDSGIMPTVVMSHSSGSSFPVGVTQVTYIFTDAAGNEALCQFTVNGK